MTRFEWIALVALSAMLGRAAFANLYHTAISTCFVAIVRVKTLPPALPFESSITCPVKRCA